MDRVCGMQARPNTSFSTLVFDSQVLYLLRYADPGFGLFAGARVATRARRRALSRRRMMYEPWNALEAPRFTGPRTYARLPYVKDLDGVQAAVYGMPWDGGASFRSGARFGPEGVRSASGMIRTYNAVLGVQVFGALSTIDYGDAPTAPGYIEDTLSRIETFVRPLAQAGVTTVGIGGDHSVALAEVRALASVYGPLGLVHLDSHTDLWDLYNGHPYAHGTMFRRALEEGVIDRVAWSKQASGDLSMERQMSRSRRVSESRRSRGSTRRDVSYRVRNSSP